ncbi:MAG TPA: methionine--tRNA ligase [Patescibacteria group bacterium]|nr:methionine--tRNA ligase [Patescibacteria group bacterium]
MKTFYNTTTTPYVNADPHIGFALEIIQADVIARYHRLLGETVVFNTGTDEHGQKIYEKALEAHMSPKTYSDMYAEKFKALKNALSLSYTNFVRTTDAHHIAAAQEFWNRCKAHGDIYKKFYKIKYCVGCELEKTDSELVNGTCVLHPNLELQIYEEENYFFRFSKYQQPLLDFYASNPDFVVPQSKFNEIISFVTSGLEDFSISRLKSKMPWGIDVPDDNKHVMYVWFDALINYISTIGWPDDEKQFKTFWPVVQFAGKDQVRQQAAMWQAMLFSAGLPSSKQIFIHGFMTVEGQKMSKSLGNVINPFEVVDIYGTDALRYYLLAKIHPWEDSNFSWDKFKEVYNADLANGLGNLVARVAKLCETSRHIESRPINSEISHVVNTDAYSKALVEYRFSDAIAVVWKKIRELDGYLDQEKPWDLLKNVNPRVKDVLSHAVDQLQEIAGLLSPFLSNTADTITKQFQGPEIQSQKPLFPRLQ